MVLLLLFSQHFLDPKKTSHVAAEQHYSIYSIFVTFYLRYRCLMKRNVSNLFLGVSLVTFCEKPFLTRLAGNT